MYPYSHQFLPCFHCHPQAYIRKVQHLVERCLLLHMSRDECVKALAHHANIRPLITHTVWKELQKENPEFFRAYFRTISRHPFLTKFTRSVPRIMRRQYQWRCWTSACIWSKALLQKQGERWSILCGLPPPKRNSTPKQLSDFDE